MRMAAVGVAIAMAVTATCSVVGVTTAAAAAQRAVCPPVRVDSYYPGATHGIDLSASVPSPTASPTFDMDGDGSLTQLELAALLRSLGIKPRGDQISLLLNQIDRNGNGSVEFDELVVAIMPDLNEEVLINQEQLMEVFRSFDRDGNGQITAAELAGSMAKMGHPLTYRELTEMMTEADSNGDGVISFNEFAHIMAKSAADFLGLTAAA